MPGVKRLLWAGKMGRRMAAICLCVCLLPVAAGAQSPEAFRQNLFARRAEASDSPEEWVEWAAEALESVGVTGLTREARREILASFQALPEEVAESMDRTDALFASLTYLGIGRFDGEGNRFPTSAVCYAFDIEAFHLSAMYTQFLRGVADISGGLFAPEAVEEDATGVSGDGSGVQVIRFTLRGKQYEYRAEAYYDWFDLGALAFCNGVLADAGVKERLYCAGNDQTCFCFFADEAWAERFKRATGIALAAPDQDTDCPWYE